MKKLLLFCLILAACSKAVKVEPKFKEGDMVLTKFQDTVLILKAPTCKCNNEQGRYLVEKKDYHESYALEAELSEKLVP